MQTDKILHWIKKDAFVLLCSAGIALFWLICRLVHPATPIFINEADPVYLPVVGIISFCFLAMPVIAYACTPEFLQLRWQAKFMAMGIALMLATIVFCPYAYLHAQILFFVFTGIDYFTRKDMRLKLPPLFYFACWIYVIWLAISMTWSQNASEATRYFNRLVPLASYSFTFMFIYLSEQNYRQLILLFWRVVCVACLLTIASGIYEAQRLGFDFSDFIQFKKTMILGTPVYDFLYAWSGTGHPSFNALWLMAGLACSFFLVDRHCITRFELIISCLLILFVVIITQSRVGSVMWSLITLAGVIYVLRHHKYALWSTLSILGLISLCVGITQIDLLRSIYSDPARLSLVKISSDYLHVDPWKGCGLGGMTYEYLESVIGYEFKSWWPQYAYSTTMYPHNQFIGDWMQSGIVGLIVSLGWVVCGFYTAIKQHNYIGVAYIAAVFIFMLIEMPFHFLGGTTIIAFFLSLVLGKRLTPANGKVSDTPACDSSTRTK